MLLTTPRLTLRELEETDFEALCELDRDAETWRYEHPPLSEDGTRARMRNILAWREESPRTCFAWAVLIPPGERLMGLLSLRQTNPAIREYETGWAIRREEWGKGYASEAARAVQRYAFEQVRAHRLVAFCHAENRASERVMQKLGMTREGRTRETAFIDGVWCDELVYAILEHEYRARNE